MVGGYLRMPRDNTRSSHLTDVEEEGSAGSATKRCKLEGGSCDGDSNMAITSDGVDVNVADGLTLIQSYILSPTSSRSFWHTGVAAVSSSRAGENDTPPNNRGNMLGPLSAVGANNNLLPMVPSEEENSDAPPDCARSACSGSLCEGDGNEGVASVSGGAVPSSVNLSSSSSLKECTSVCVVDHAVMCNIVPLLPKKHPEYGLVLQIVPLTLWPPPKAEVSGIGSEGGDLGKSLQTTVSFASQLHNDYLLRSDVTVLHPPTDAAQGVIVEWVSGDIGYTADSKGLWAEQRLFSQRYYTMSPVERLDIRHNGCSDNNYGKDDAEVRYTAPHLPPTTLRGAVLEQLRRFRVNPRYAPTSLTNGTRNKEWVLLFARVIEVGQDCIALTSRLMRAWATAPSRETIAMCDVLLDEVIHIGIAPQQEPHRLSLVCPSVAHRILVSQHRWMNVDKRTELSVAGSMQVVARELLEVILQAMRGTLRHRIALQYELIRLLRAKPLMFANNELVVQYSRWYTTIAPPNVILHVLAGSTIFSGVMSQLHIVSGRVMARSQVERVCGNGGDAALQHHCGGSLLDDDMEDNDVSEDPPASDNEPSRKRGRPRDEVKNRYAPANGAKHDGSDDNYDDNDSDSDDNDDDNDDDDDDDDGDEDDECSGEEEEGTGDTESTNIISDNQNYQRHDVSAWLRAISDSADNIPLVDLVSVPYEMDLLDEGFVTRFCAILRGQGPTNNKGGGSSHGVGGSGSGSGAAGSSPSGHTGCDEVALSCVASWLKRTRCTMTTADLESYVRKLSR
ncbi:hypothetical protein, conserved [Trypanosoma brucei gambiense DAL972]|uniref:Uncharacterized protein n=1 Tax=Trypanosoma brucei gambiense (strain MHOM/CI/86/DAL972) TaxID=679716 RepID=C9ZHZ9_TRYB9|nr:hypothetical protein, conserved [Trypanosoma brucei gambiense DAL972]CBH09116.1 hypothetical protein, conserved [Trypanosoma brucei gambiense DAL972]|eukprot:XP_011771557.1 hypothetical protein, conserved [Trypanosoma brucei gambiense DAL972]